jgi:hypothetical protein
MGRVQRVRGASTYYAGAAALIPQSDNATQFSASGHFVLIDVTGH